MIALMKAEFIKLFSLRGTWVVLPTAMILGIAASVGMCIQAYIAAEVFQDSSSLNWDPEQVMHWLRLITVTLFSLWAVISVAGENRAGTMALTCRASRGVYQVLLAKWIVTGLVAALLIAVLVPVTVIVDTIAVPSVTQDWSPLAPAVLHFQWTLPLYAFLTCGIGVGLGTCARLAALGVGGLLCWQFILEPFSILAPKGNVLYALLPFNNGGIFTGEESQYPLPFGGAMASGAWFTLWTLLVLALGGWRLFSRQR